MIVVVAIAGDAGHGHCRCWGDAGGHGCCCCCRRQDAAGEKKKKTLLAVVDIGGLATVVVVTGGAGRGHYRYCCCCRRQDAAGEKKKKKKNYLLSLLSSLPSLALGVLTTVIVFCGGAGCGRHHCWGCW